MHSQIRVPPVPSYTRPACCSFKFVYGPQVTPEPQTLAMQTIVQYGTSDVGIYLYYHYMHIVNLGKSGLVMLVKNIRDQMPRIRALCGTVRGCGG